MEHESWRHTGFCFLSPSTVHYTRAAYRRSRDRIHFHRRLTFTHKHSYYTEYSSIQTGVFRPLVERRLIESDSIWNFQILLRLAATTRPSFSTTRRIFYFKSVVVTSTAVRADRFDRKNRFCLTVLRCRVSDIKVAF